MRVFGESAALLAGGTVAPDELAGLELQIADDGPVPPGPRCDVHVHLGRDRDGHAFAADTLRADLDLWGIERAVVFPLNDPGPDGDFAPANDAVTAAAGASSGRLVPFCRVDPTRGAAAAIAGAAAGGARGLKLHPVAQGFAPDADASVACVADATARGWPVVIHAGFGARPLADGLVRLLAAVPGARLVLAHGARGDARAVRAAMTAHPGVSFDTSLAALSDLVELPPERLIFGSDRPYGEYATALQLVGLAARVAGWSERQLAAVISGNFDRLLGGGDADA